MNKYIAGRNRNLAAGLSLDTAALSKYDDIIDLSIGDVDIGTDRRIIEAAAGDAVAGYTHYGDPKGDPELIAEISRMWREDYHIPVGRDEVLITASAEMGMTLALLAVADPGDEIITLSPYYPEYRAHIRFVGGVQIDVPLRESNRYQVDRKALEDAITEKTKAIIINYPNNPTGANYDIETLRSIAEIAEKYDLVVISDEIYTEYVYDGCFIPIRSIPGMEKRTVTINTFSKNFFMTGWRIGSVIADSELIDIMNAINEPLIYSAPSVSQRAALHALRMRKEICPENRDILKRRIEYSCRRVSEIPYFSLTKPAGTFYLFPGIEKTGLSSDDFSQLLFEEKHILVSSGTVFGDAGKGHIRIACNCSIEKLGEAFDRMEELKF